MSIFDKMFGSGAAAATASVDGNARFNELKAKYQSVLNAVEQQNVQLDDLHVADNKLVMNGTAPTEAAMNAVWDQIKMVDANWSEDLTAEIKWTETKPETEAYTVLAGDSLWRIAQHKLGDGNQYMKIFYANRDKLETPNSVFHPGDILRIPKA
jgi:nucleoid-associated protein YgaU